MPISLGTTTVTALYLGTTSISSAYLGNTQVFGGSFTPLDLFSGGAQGIWLDPSDLTTMFSDRAGTIQVTTPGTVVGKRLDKSGRGNHATAPTDAARPIYGVEPKGGRRNLLTWSEGFNTLPWQQNATSTVENGPTSPVGTATADTLSETAVSGFHFLRQDATVSAGAYTLTVYLKAGTQRYGGAHINFDGTARGCSIDLQTGTLGTPYGGASAVRDDVGDGWYRLRVSATASAPSGPHAAVFISNANSLASYAGNTANNILVWGAQLELGSTATAYQRTTTAYDVTESGVPTTHYVQYDGSDDSMSTAAIDFTATDKMSVFAGASRIGTTAGVLVEWGAGVPSGLPGFFFYRPSATEIMFRSSGTIEVTVTATPATQNSVFTGLGDIGGDRATLRINGTQVGQNTNNQGTGTYGNYSLFFGRRNNSNLPFSGKDYGIIVVGKAASAGEITDTETWLAAKTAQVTL